MNFLARVLDRLARRRWHAMAMADLFDELRRAFQRTQATDWQATSAQMRANVSWVFAANRQISGRGARVELSLDLVTRKGHGPPQREEVWDHPFLDLVAQLPEGEREKAVQRLRVITPDRPWVVPLNLLAVPDFTWAGNAIVQVGRRIWDDYWGPRMQAALLGLFRLAHVWNRAHPRDGLGLLHVVFMAFNREWRHKAVSLLPCEYNIYHAQSVFVNSLASAYFEEGNLEKAQENYEKIIGMTTGRLISNDLYTKAFYMLGKTLEQQGNTTKAIEHYEQFLQLWKDADPGLPEVDDAHIRLSNIRGRK